MPGVAERRVAVFFYGLFMDEEALRKKGLAPTDGRVAFVRGFALVSAGRPGCGSHRIRASNIVPR